MLRILGSRKTACDGVTRRDLLQIGGLGLFGVGLADLLRLQASAAPSHLRFGQAKACILIHLFGAHPQHETFDPKPAAPAEIQGEMDAGRSPPLNPPLAKGGTRGGVPRNMALPFRLYARANFALLGGPYAGFLGSRYDPVWTDFSAQGTRPVPNPTGRTDLLDPYGGIRPEDRFDLAGDMSQDLSIERLGLRRSLLAQFDRARANIDERSDAFTRNQEMAFSLLTSPRLAQALDVAREPRGLRDRYGMNLFGQSLLAARRLVEAGSRCVTVFWDAYGDATAGWDTHYYHYPRLREFLLPGFDAGFSTLILDLEARGLLDETLVLVLSEHGRTPRLTNRPGAGREHWSTAYCGALAGGGVARGQVVGRTDSIAGHVADNPVSPKDILATALHLLAIDPHTMVADRLGRPVPVAGEGVVRREMLA